MTLYAIPFTCSFAVRLTLAARDLPHEVRWMRRHEHRLDDGASFDVLNPKRRVPALRLPDGELLTEIVAILAFLDRDVPRPDAERRRHLEWLCWTATELHRPPLFTMFDPTAPPEVARDAEERLLPPALAYVDAALTDRPTLLGGPEASPADDYLFWALTLCRFRRIAAARTPALDAWYAGMLARPTVAAVMSEERAMLARYGTA